MIYYKIVFEDGGSIYKPLFKYKVGEVKECDDFNPSETCEHGLHYGDLYSCIEAGLNNLSVDFTIFKGGHRIINTSMLLYKHKFKLLEVEPVGQIVSFEGKFKTDKLKIIRELPPSECIKVFMTDESLKVREFGLIYLSIQNKELKNRFDYYLNEYDKELDWIRQWNFLKDLNKFIGREVYYNKNNETINKSYKEYAGKIKNIDDNLVAELEPKDYTNIYWLDLKC